MAALLQGLLAGSAHVLTGPDHLAGVAPLALDRPRRARPAVVGAAWGLGHGLGVALLGLLGQTLLVTGDIAVASIWAERLVGAVLIGIGLVALRRARGLVVHAHPHAHGRLTHSHLHVHEPGPESDRHDGRAPQHRHRHPYGAFGLGVLHGFAGAGHLWVALPSLAMGPAGAAAYLGGYLGVSVLVMTAFGASLGRVAAACGERAVARLLAATAVASIVIGAGWLILSWC
jgi:hypothetical protein